jgi:phosphatidylserine decarboxylase
MKHAGEAGKAGRKLIWWTLVLLLAVMGGGLCAVVLGSLIAMSTTVLIGIWFLFALFTLFFFRDPAPNVPAASESIIAPAHGKVDAIEEITESEFIAGPCRRISVFLSVFDVHVQYAPVAGKIALLRYRPGQFFNAMKMESAVHNENVLLGIESSEIPGEKIGVRLIAGWIARRIVPWVELGDPVARGERISLIQFGSRCDLYLPLTARVLVKIGDKVRGGETVMATRRWDAL